MIIASSSTTLQVRKKTKLHNKVSIHICSLPLQAEPNGPPSGHGYRDIEPHACMDIETDRNPSSSYFMVNMPSGMDHGRVSSATTTSCNMAAVL